MTQRRNPSARSPQSWPAYRRLPPFAPVPVRARRDGWDAERQGRFIGYLAETGSVAQAAARVGRSRESAYRLRRRADAAGFAAAWDAALAGRAGIRIPARKVTPDNLLTPAFAGIRRVRCAHFGPFCVNLPSPARRPHERLCAIPQGRARQWRDRRPARL